MPSTKITKNEYEDASGEERIQYRTTVPKSVVELLDISEAELEWEAQSRNRIQLTIKRGDDDE